jgi:HPt (histidine-containing phosphotransfer) domain-containing protein
MTRFVSIDLVAAVGRLPGGKRGVRQLAEVFIGECVEIMELLRTAIPDGDPVLVARNAHTLKGSSNLFFAHGVHEMAVKIESKARENDLAGAAADLPQLEAEVDHMLCELKAFLSTT